MTPLKVHFPARFSISFSYYGLAMDLQNFGVSIYLIQVIFGAVDVPAKLVVTVSVSYVGRRVSLMVALFLAGLVIIANIFVSTGGCGGRGGSVTGSSAGHALLGASPIGPFARCWVMHLSASPSIHISIHPPILCPTIQPHLHPTTSPSNHPSTSPSIH